MSGSDKHVSEDVGEATSGPQSASEIVGAPCWLRGAGWEASLALGLLLAVGGAAMGATRAYEALSITTTVAIALLVLLWDRPLARFPLVAFLIGIDGGFMVASGSIRVVIPPFFVEADRFGSSLAIDPIAVVVIVDVLARLRGCLRAGETLKTTPSEEALMVPR